MRLVPKSLIAVLLLSFAFDAAALEPPLVNPSARDAAITDPLPDAEYPTANKQLLVPSGGVGMNALFHLASGSGRKPTLILLHGLPGNERNMDLAQAVRRDGWNVLTFTYRGVWGSPGRFSIAGSVEDAAAAVAFLHRPEVAEKYKVDPARIVLGGHSMGGFAAAKYAATHDDIAALLLLDAWNVGEDARAVRASPAKYQELVSGIDDLGGIAESNKALADAIQAAGAKQLRTAHFPADHAFSDHRIALSRTVIAWLDTLVPHQ